MTLALVTGGTGFVGSHLVDALLSRGSRVRCLVRSRSRLRWLEGSDVELVEGDCTDPSTLAGAVADVDVIYHAAGITWAARESDYMRHNVEGTRNLLDACRAMAPGALRRFVLVSSQAAAGPGADRKPRTESDPPAPITAYGVSKLEAERLASGYIKHFSVVVVRPCAVYGPRDTGFLDYFRLVRRGFLVEFGAGEDRVVSLCHARDVADGLIQAADSQVASGSVYFLADSEPYPWREVASMMEEAMGVSARRLVIPTPLLWLLAGAGQLYSRTTGKPVKLNRTRAAELAAPYWGCDISNARRDLDFAPKTNLKDGLREVVRWYKKEQWL